MNNKKKINKNIFIDDFTKEEFDFEILKGIDDIENGNVKSASEVDKLLKENLGI